MIKKILVAINICLLLSSCATKPKEEPLLNPLQLQAMQTNDFKVSKRDALNAVVTVFQNEGYTVEAANLDTGFVTARSATSDKPMVQISDESMPTSEKVAIGAAAVAAVAAIAVLASHDHSANDSGVPITTGVSSNPHNPVYCVVATAFITQAKKSDESHIRLSFVQHKNDTSAQIQYDKFYQTMFNKIRQQLFVGDSATGA